MGFLFADSSGKELQSIPAGVSFGYRDYFQQTILIIPPHRLAARATRLTNKPGAPRPFQNGGIRLEGICNFALDRKKGRIMAGRMAVSIVLRFCAIVKTSLYI